MSSSFVYHWGKRYLLSMGNTQKSTDAADTEGGYADAAGAPFVLGATASFTFTFGDSEFNDVNDGTLRLISTNGTDKTYTIANDGGSSTIPEFQCGANATAAATNLKAAIEHADGHNGTLFVEQSGAVLIITQAAHGLGGNTTITSAADFDNTCDVNPPATFTGGDRGALRAILVKTGTPCGTKHNAARVVDADSTYTDNPPDFTQRTGIAVDEASLLPVQDGSNATIHVTLNESPPQTRSVSGQSAGTIKISCDPVAFYSISEEGATLGGMLVYLARDSSDNWATGTHAADATDLEHSIPFIFVNLGGSLTDITAFTVTFGDGVMLEAF